MLLTLILILILLIYSVHRPQSAVRVDILQSPSHEEVLLCVNFRSWRRDIPFFSLVKINSLYFQLAKHKTKCFHWISGFIDLAKKVPVKTQPFFYNKDISGAFFLTVLIS